MTVMNMDCIEGMRLFPDAYFDSIVTDPPYELGFMGKGWDSTGIANSVEMWREALRVLKPGGHLLAFSGSRTYHRMVCAIEDAGFEIRDQIMWVYGSGFPKSLDVSKAIDKAAGAEREVVGINPNARSSVTSYKNEDGRKSRNAMADDAITAPATDAARQRQGWGTALKPAHEPIVVARKPLIGTVAANVLAHGTGAINVDGCRVDGTPRTTHKEGNFRTRNGGQTMNEGFGVGAYAAAAGRWPANLIHDGSDKVIAAFPQAPGQIAKASTSDTQRVGQNVYGDMTRDRGAEASAGSENTGGVGFKMKPGARRLDGGSAARFFQTCESRYDDDLWQDLNLPSSDAATAHPNLRRLRQAVFFALALAARKALPAALLWDVSLSTEPITAATPTQLRQLAAALTQTIQSIDSAYWLAPERARLSLSLNLVQSAVLPTLTDTTTITLSHWLSDGSAEPVTFSITPTSWVAGAKDCVPSWAAEGARFKYCAKASKADRGEGNTHPTVKPTDLMRYLCRLVTPPGGTVLDPFTGSGSTGKAAALEGFGFIGFELSAEYAAIAIARITEARK